MNHKSITLAAAALLSAGALMTAQAQTSSTSGGAAAPDASTPNKSSQTTGIGANSNEGNQMRKSGGMGSSAGTRGAVDATGGPSPHATDSMARQSNTAGATDPSNTAATPHRGRSHTGTSGTNSGSTGSTTGSEVVNSGPNAVGSEPGTTR